MSIDITKLTPAELKTLKEQVKEQEKADKQKRSDNVVSFKQLSEDFVNRHIDSMVHHHEITGSLIEKLWKDYETIRELKAMVYGTKINEQDSHTSTLENGNASITIGWNVSIGFDGTESAGVEKIKEFINSLSTEDTNNKKLSAAVHTFLKPNSKTGMLNPVKIIELSKLKSEFNDERFDDGLEIIFNAQYRRQNSMYVSGWKILEIDRMPKKLEFRFAV